MYQQAIGRVHPAVPGRGGLQVDGEALTTGEQGVAGDMGPGSAEHIEGVGDVALVQDTSAYDGLRQPDRIAESAAEAVGVEGEPGGIGALAADLSGLDLHDQGRLGGWTILIMTTVSATAGPPVPVLPGVDVSVAAGLAVDGEGGAALGGFFLARSPVGLHLREGLVVDDLAAGVQGEDVQQADSRRRPRCPASRRRGGVRSRVPAPASGRLGR